MALFKNPSLESLKKKASEGIQAAQEKAQGADVGSVLRKAAGSIAVKADEAAKAIDKNTKDFDVPQKLRAASGAASAGLAAASRAVRGDAESPAIDNEPDAGAAALINLMCCFAASDGEITQLEREKIFAIAVDMGDGPDDDPGRRAVVEDAIALIDADGREFEYAVAAKVGAQRILEGMDLTEQEKRSLCWNLHALAHVDGISDRELDFIRFVNEKSGVSKSAAEELGSYAAAIAEIAVERKKLIATDRCYSEIQPLVTELEKRERVLLEAAWALVSDSDN